MAEKELTPEDLKKMTPEQIAELQRKQCIFCHIISGKVNAKKVYEDDKVVAVLDINPANPGHVLLLPKEHYAIMPQIPDELIRHLFVKAKHISHTHLSALKATGTNIFAANGAVAGQKAPHFMIHIIPRKESDGVALELPENEIPEEEMNKLYEHLHKKFSKFFPGNVPDISVPDSNEAEIGEAEKEMPEKSSSENNKEKIKDEHKESEKGDSEITIDDITSLLGGK